MAQRSFRWGVMCNHASLAELEAHRQQLLYDLEWLSKDFVKKSSRLKQVDNYTLVREKSSAHAIERRQIDAERKQEMRLAGTLQYKTASDTQHRRRDQHCAARKRLAEMKQGYRQAEAAYNQRVQLQKRIEQN